MLYCIEENILAPAGLANAAAIASGVPPPHVLTKAFFDAFTRMGGSGCTLCLIIAILLKSRNSGSQKLCLLALLPALCNVNEPLLFGIPLVLNPIYLIPFLVAPCLQTVAAYGATLAGFVPYTAANGAWTTPALISGFTATGSMQEISNNALNYYLERIQGPFPPKREKNPGKFVAYSACLVADNLESKSIVCHTISGTNVRLTSSRRPHQTIYGLTPDPRVMMRSTSSLSRAFSMVTRSSSLSVAASRYCSSPASRARDRQVMGQGLVRKRKMRPSLTAAMAAASPGVRPRLMSPAEGEARLYSAITAMGAPARMASEKDGRLPW